MTLSKQKKNILLAVLIILSIAVHFLWLDLRPLHHDEGNNYFFAQRILKTGMFIYNPENFHGPTYFFALLFSFLIFGINEFSLRFPAAFFGVLLVFLPIFFRLRHAYLQAFFLLLSPSILYYSRYSIHETLFVLLSMLALLLTTRLISTQNISLLPLLAITLALLITTKETSMITLAVLGFIVLLHLKTFMKIPWKKEKLLIFNSLYLFCIIFLAFSSSFFFHIQGTVGVFKGFFPWTQKGIEGGGHLKPPWYYLQLLLQYETPLLFFGLLGVVFSLRKNDILFKNLAIWFILHLLIYSFIPYKVPWLIINITAPLALLAAAAIGELQRKKIQRALAVCSLLFLAFFSLLFNFLYPWQEKNPFAYVHTDRDILRLTEKIRSITNHPATILIFSDVYWPLPFYLHGNTVSYLSDAIPFRIEDYSSYDLIIAKTTFLPSSFPKERILGKYKLRKGVYLYLIQP